jgi:rhodanese-related sulfurtransferase
MKILSKTILSVFALLFMISCNGQGKVESKLYDSLLTQLLEHNVPEVSVKEVKKSDVIYLDAREINEYQVSHIKGAIWIGYADFKMKRVQSISKTSKIVVYCSVGYRSEKITQKLIAKGYTNVSNLYGGIFEWVNENHSLVNDDNQTTIKIHAYNKEWGVWLTSGEKVY